MPIFRCKYVELRIHKSNCLVFEWHFLQYLVVKIIVDFFEPVNHVTSLVLLLDGVLDPERREADPRRVDAHLRRRERRVWRSSASRREHVFDTLFVARSACDRMGPACQKEALWTWSKSYEHFTIINYDSRSRIMGNFLVYDSRDVN